MTANTTMAIDLAPLWDFSKPEVSEQRFRAHLASATGDDVLVLQTQIARTFGLRKDFAKAQGILQSIAKDAPTAGPEARARYALELGRTYASAAHPPERVTAESRRLARASFESARAIAKDARLDGLAIDAIHMLAFVDTAPADQLKWGQEALAVVEASLQPDAKKWEASVRNNVGYAFHQLGQFDNALVQFKQALVLRERGTNSESIRAAHWMVAWTLRALGRMDEALETQLRLEREYEAAKAPNRYVYEELEALYRARGDAVRAQHYADLVKSTPGT
ncbi:MAG: tetratricopeptide repeat protein [Pseudomonadota bacterium]